MTNRSVLPAPPPPSPPATFTCWRRELRARGSPVRRDSGPGGCLCRGCSVPHLACLSDSPTVPYLHQHRILRLLIHLHLGTRQGEGGEGGMERVLEGECDVCCDLQGLVFLACRQLQRLGGNMYTGKGLLRRQPCDPRQF
ncbi:hypothetical protein E2C01_041363 [Portunus trituberculatus]|uniref:Uncharacterized protein n=1 Tax=Portunus trituberculatus TaxID=210409 RepID=A0A5B7FRJ1_PORTR|nr:hypothetical protein [Portunus trituberculatus]